jgi:sugar lactone lactonase YvrE
MLRYSCGSLRPAIVCAAVAFAAACSSGSVTGSPVVVTTPPVGSASGEAFVSNQDSRTARITVFPAGDTTPLRQFPITGGSAVAADGTGMLYATGRDGVDAIAAGGSSVVRTIKVAGHVSVLACDGHGDLYVLSENGRTSRIDEYGHGGTPLLRTITDKLSDTTSLAFDDSGVLYAGNESGGPNDNGSVSVYEPGATTAKRTMDYTGHPRALAVDASGNLYVADSHLNSVNVYPPGAATPAKSFTDHVNYPILLAVDSTRGFLYVGPGMPGPAVAGRLLVFDLKNDKLTANIDVSPRVLALAASGDLYVLAGSGPVTVRVYPPGPGEHTPPKVIRTDVSVPRALAIGG